MNEVHPIIAFFIEYWQFIFLYAFKYLRDIDKKLDTLHTDNQIKETKINHLEQEIKDLKVWIQRVEDKI